MQSTRRPLRSRRHLLPQWLWKERESPIQVQMCCVNFRSKVRHLYSKWRARKLQKKSGAQKSERGYENVTNDQQYLVIQIMTIFAKHKLTWELWSSMATKCSNTLVRGMVAGKKCTACMHTINTRSPAISASTRLIAFFGHSNACLVAALVVWWWRLLSWRFACVKVGWITS